MTHAQSQDASPATPNPLAPILWLIEAFWQYKWLVVMLMAAGVVAAATLAGRLPNVYWASGLVEINPGRDSLIPERRTQSNFVPPETITETEVQVIQSYAVLERVVDALDLEFSSANPALSDQTLGGRGRAVARAAIIDDLRRKLLVQPTGRSYVVRVGFEGRDPEFVAAVVNEVMRQYLRLDVAAQRDQATESISQISARLAELRQGLDEREQAVEDFRAQSRIADGAGTTALSEQLARLNEELIRAQGALALAQATSDQRGAGEASLPQVVASPLIQELQSQAAEQERVVTELSALYRPSHPRLIQAREALDALQANIAVETRKIVESLATAVAVEAERVDTLELQIDMLRDRIAAQRAAEIELRRLEREVEAAQRIYEVLLNRYREEQGTAGLERPDGRIVAAAVPPVEPSGPNRILVVAGGGILAGAAAFALVLGIALIDQRLRTRGDIVRAVGIAPVAEVPPVPANGGFPGLRSRKRNAAFAEAITHLRAALVLRSGGREVTVVAMTAPDPAVGHAALITALGQACAVAGESTVLVDADFDRPSVHTRLGGKNEFGVAELVSLGGEVDAALQIDRATALNYLAAGADGDASLYRTDAMGRLVDALYVRFDVILINLPPIVERPDAQALAAEAGVVAIAVKAGATSRPDLLETVQTLRFVGPSLPLATVLIRG